MKLKRFPKLLLIPLVLIGIGLLTTIPALLSKKTAPTSSESSIPSDWKTFRQEQYGYTIRHPQDWQAIDESTENSRQLRVIENNKNASVKINSYIDEAMTSEERVKQGIALFKDRLYSEPGLTVKQYADDFEDRVGGWIARGEQVINGQTFIFENRGLLSDNGRVLIFHSNYRADKADQYTTIVPLIVSSFNLL